MKKTITLLLLVISSASYSQYFWTEDFGTGACTSITANTYSGTNGLWSITVTGTEGLDPNLWYVSAVEAGMGEGNCGGGCNVTTGLTNRTLHISNNTSSGGMGDVGAAYDAGGLCGIISCPMTSRRAESPLINCSGISNINLSFNYEMGGEPGSDFGNVQVSADNGATWTVVSSLGITNTCAGGQGLWTSVVITLPTSCNNNPNVKIGFYWQNDDNGVGTDPSFAVDDIHLGWGIGGYTFKDNNGNCLLDAGETGMHNVVLKKYDSVGTLLSQTSSSTNGRYYFGSNPGTYRIEVDTTGTYYTVNCAHPGTDTTFFMNSNLDSINFAIACKPYFDLGVQYIARAGWVFPGQYHYLYTDAGDLSQWLGFSCGAGVSGTVQITMTGPVTYYSPQPGALTPSVAGNVFTYTIPDFGAINNSTAFNLRLRTNVTATVGDIVCATVVVTATSGTEINTYNNTLQYCYNVVNSYDPNIKETTPANVVVPYNDYFTYTVGFQNTGSAPAFNIVVKDTLSPLLDLATFQLIGYSHENTFDLTGNKLAVTFPNIMLQDSTTNEPLSHGWFQYKIKPLVNLPAGTQIFNTASIYFDYNAPVVTNTTTNNFITTVGINENGITGFSIIPNPATSTLTISSENDKIKDIHIYSVLGELVYQSSLNNNQSSTTINVGNLTNGMYFVEATTDKGSVRKKFIKQ